MDDLRASRMASLEAMRVKAFSLGGPLGHLLSKSFDLIQTVVRDGVQSERVTESLNYSIESLSRERELAMSRDMDKDDPLRSLIYGLTESMGTMVESILEEKQQGLPLYRMKVEWQRASTDLSLPMLEHPVKDEDMDDISDSWMNTLGDDPCSSTHVPNLTSAMIEDAPCCSSQAQETRPSDRADLQADVGQSTSSAATTSVAKASEGKTSSGSPPKKSKPSLAGYYDDDHLEESEEEKEDEEDDDWHPHGDELADASDSRAARRRKRADQTDKQFIVGSDMEEEDDDYEPRGDEATTSSSVRKRKLPDRKDKQRSAEIDFDALHLRERCRICHKSVAKLAMHMIECHETVRPKRTCKTTGRYKEEDIDDEEEEESPPNRPKRTRASTGMYKEEEEDDEDEDETCSNDNETACSSTSKPSVDATLICDKCDRKFDTSRGLKIHGRACEGKTDEKSEEKSPADDICPFQKNDVKARITPGDASSTPDRPFGCPHCPLNRLSMNMLNHHLRTYHDLKPYECNICEAKFSRRRELKEHRAKEGHARIIVVD